MQLPLFKINAPWRPPELLDLTNEHTIALDTETYDPNLKIRGPGYSRMDGRIVGIALATANHTLYLPFGHHGGDNLDEEKVLSYVKTLAQDPTKDWIFANAPYDLGWLQTRGISICGRVRDIQVAESLLDEERLSYSLDTISKHHLGQGKDERLLREISAIQGKDFNPKADLWRLPARYVGVYAEADARRTYDVYQRQIPILKSEGLWPLWEMESSITKISHRMTTQGVRVDLKKAQILNDELTVKENALMKQFSFDIWSPPAIARYCDSEGVEYPKTEKGNPSITKQFMVESNNPKLKALRELRELNRLRKVFIEDGILRNNIKGRVHSQFVQTSREDDSGGISGTRSGRFSSKNPNLQQVPKRSTIGKQIRGLYIAEDGCIWSKCDYSSQEPRLQVHYGLDREYVGARDAADAFIAGKKLYTFFEETIGLPYDMCKDIFLGKSYGMGVPKMALTLDMSEDKCKETLELYDTTFPFLGLLNRAVQTTARNRGFIRTILGRKMRFESWAPRMDWDVPKDKRINHTPIRGRAQAFARFTESERKLAEAEGREVNAIELERAFVYKALNRFIQGSAADQTKKAMVDLEEAGLGCQLPVHDELNKTDCQSEADAFKQKEIMEQAVPLLLPTVADLDMGDSWQ